MMLNFKSENNRNVSWNGSSKLNAEMRKAEWSQLQESTFPPFFILLISVLCFKTRSNWQLGTNKTPYLGTEEEEDRQEEWQHSQKLQTPSNTSFQAKVLK